MADLREGAVYDVTVRDGGVERTLHRAEYLGLDHQEMDRAPTSVPEPDLHVFVHEGNRVGVTPWDLLRAVPSDGANGPDRSP